MRKVILTGAAIAIGLTGTAWAGAKDKSSNTLADRGAAGIINNTTVKTKIKSKGCTLQIQAKTVNLADDEIVICIAEGDIISTIDGGNSLILAGEAKAGKLKIKADLSEAKAAGLGCGDVEALSYNGQVKCYLDDLTYRLDSAGAGTWRAGCAANGMLAGDSPALDAKMLKKNPTVPVVIGLCQGFVEGARITPPASVEWALTGQRNGVIP